MLEANQEKTSNLKGFIIFWSGQIFSILGSAIVQFVLGWWVTIETQSPLMLSLALFIGFIPTILLAPIAGVFIDRWNRKIVIATVDFLQALVTVVLLFLFWYNFVTVQILLIFLAVRGIFQAFHDPSIQALIPIMVPRKHLNRINSTQFFLNSIIFLIGPIVAALLFKVLDIHQLLSIDAITFLIAVVPLILIKIPKIVKTTTTKKEKASFFKDFKEGVVFIKDKKGLLPLLLTFAATNFFLMPLFTLLNLFVYTNHGGNESQLAYVLAFNQAGTIVGSLIFIFWKGFKKKIVGVVLGILALNAGFLFLSFTPQGIFWFMGIGFLIIGLALPMANISSQTIWQAIVPKEMLGRVMSVRFAVAQFTAPLGMILSGLIAEVVNIQYVYIVAASLGIIFLVLNWFFTPIRKVEEGIDYNLKEEKVEQITKEKTTNDSNVNLIEGSLQ